MRDCNLDLFTLLIYVVNSNRKPSSVFVLRVESELRMVISHVIELIFAFLVSVVSASRISLLVFCYQAEKEYSTRGAAHQKHPKGYAVSDREFWSLRCDKDIARNKTTAVPNPDLHGGGN
jgi:hypothetical protein